VLDEQASLLEFLEYLADLFLVLFQCTGVDQDVVDITNTKNIEIFTESIIHESLGSGGSISKPKGHDKKFKQPVSSSKSGFSFVAFLDTDLIKTGSEVKMCEVFATPDLIKSFFNPGQGGAVLDSNIVEGSIVDAEA